MAIPWPTSNRTLLAPSLKVKNLKSPVPKVCPPLPWPNAFATRSPPIAGTAQPPVPWARTRCPARPSYAPPWPTRLAKVCIGKPVSPPFLSPCWALRTLRSLRTGTLAHNGILLVPLIDPPMLSTSTKVAMKSNCQLLEYQLQSISVAFRAECGNHFSATESEKPTEHQAKSRSSNSTSAKSMAIVQYNRQ